MGLRWIVRSVGDALGTRARVSAGAVLCDNSHAAAGAYVPAGAMPLHLDVTLELVKRRGAALTVTDVTRARAGSQPLQLSTVFLDTKLEPGARPVTRLLVLVASDRGPVRATVGDLVQFHLKTSSAAQPTIHVTTRLGL